MMLLMKEVEKYLYYCKFQKELDDKTIRAYRIDIQQFIQLVGKENLDKEVLNNCYPIFTEKKLHRIIRSGEEKLF